MTEPTTEKAKEEGPVKADSLARRISRLEIDPRVLIQMFQKGLVFEITKGIEPGTQFRGVVMDPQRNTMNVFVEHPDFEEVEDGQIAPMIEVEVKKIEIAVAEEENDVEGV